LSRIRPRAAPPLLLVLALSGCVQTAAAIITAPVRIVGAGINTVAPSQSKRDRARGKRERKAEAKAAREQRKADKSPPKDAHAN